MATRRIDTQTLTNIADAIRAKTGGSSAMTPAEMVTEIESIPSGTTITDGIVVKARDASGFPTEIDYYNSTGVIASYELGGDRAVNRAFQRLTKCTVKSDISSVGGNAFYGDTMLTDIVFEGTATTVGSGVFQTCNALRNVDLPFEYIGQSVFQSVPLVTAKLPLLKTSTGNNGAFRLCTSLQTAELGSVGHAVESLNNIFMGCTQTGLTITVYSLGSTVDRFVTAIRQGATNATIIIKASENTTYNGTSYAAGDTILTSEVSA